MLTNRPAPVDREHRYASQTHIDGPFQWRGLCNHGLNHPCGGHYDGKPKYLLFPTRNPTNQLPCSSPVPMVPYPVVDGPVAKHLYPSSYPTYPLSNHSSAEGAARSVSAPSSANPAGPQIHIPIHSRAAACRPPQGRTGRRITTLPLYRRRQRGEAMSIY